MGKKLPSCGPWSWSWWTTASSRDDLEEVVSRVGGISHNLSCSPQNLEEYKFLNYTGVVGALVLQSSLLLAALGSQDHWMVSAPRVGRLTL